MKTLEQFDSVLSHSQNYMQFKDRVECRTKWGYFILKVKIL